MQTSAAAYAWLRHRIAQSARDGVSRLPPLKTLAAACGVSTVTMWRALRRCRQEELVLAAPRRGIELLGAASAMEPRAARRTTPAARTAESAFSRDLLRGRWQAGTRLPPHKVLAHHYGVGFIRLKRMLQESVAEGRLAASGRGYVVAVHGNQLSGGTLQLLCSRPSLPALAALTERIGVMCEVLEQECCARSVRLSVRNVNDTEESGAADSLPVLGYAVAPAGMSDSALLATMRRLGSDSRRVCVLDPMGERRVVEAFDPAPRTCVVTIDSHCNAGASVGRFLLQAAHRRVAYISPYIRFDWCHDRLVGLRRSFVDAGVPGGVSAFTDATLENYGEIAEQIAQQPWYRQVERHAESLELLTDRHFGRTDHHLLGRQILPGLIDRFIESRVRPLFEEAARDSSISAWVVTNDMVALLAMQFLRARGTRRVAVVGFDGTREASLHGLSSFGFNTQAVVHEGLNYVLGPHTRRLSRPGRIVVVPGMLVQRGSTSPVP